MDEFPVDFVDCPVIQAFCVPPMKALVAELERCTSSGVIDWNFAAGIFALEPVGSYLSDFLEVK